MLSGWQCEALGPFSLRSLDLWADQPVLLLSTAKTHPLGQTAIASHLYNAREGHWWSRWVLEQLQKHPVTSSIALGCFWLQQTGQTFQVPTFHSSRHSTLVPPHTTSSDHWKVCHDLVAVKEEAPQAVLTDVAGIRSSNRGILRAGAQTVCGEDNRNDGRGGNEVLYVQPYPF